MANQQCPDGQLFELALFAGAGGGILGGKLLGWQTVGAVEREPYAASVLVARQNDGLLPNFPIWNDVQTFRADNPECAGFIEFLRSISDRLVISGGFPCQDISAAGKGAGITGERSGLWKEFARIISEIRPAYAFIENSPMLVSRGLDVVLCDIAAMGYDAEWGVLSAADVGANHKRERVWVVAKFSHAESVYAQGQHNGQRKKQSWGGDWWQAEPNVDRVADGMAARVDRLKAVGNGQVPQCAAAAFTLLINRLNND